MKKAARIAVLISLLGSPLLAADASVTITIPAVSGIEARVNASSRDVELALFQTASELIVLRNPDQDQGRKKLTSDSPSKPSRGWVTLRDAAAGNEVVYEIWQF